MTPFQYQVAKDRRERLRAVQDRRQQVLNLLPTKLFYERIYEPKCAEAIALEAGLQIPSSAHHQAICSSGETA